MAQAGIHGLVGVAVRRWAPERPWLILGIVLGNLFPDLDNLAVAAATLTGGATEGLHRTFTHSLFSAMAVGLLFYLVGALIRQPRWRYLGWGLAAGMVMHILLDLVVWFDGVAILWPLPGYLNLWANTSPPVWWMQLMMPAEFLFFAAYFGFLWQASRRAGAGPAAGLRLLTLAQLLLFLLFTVLVYTMASGFRTVYGAVYLLSLLLAVIYTIRARDLLAPAPDPGGVWRPASG